MLFGKPKHRDALRIT